jgi:hypothetical protein
MAGAGHPRVYCWQQEKTWVAGPSTAMTQGFAARLVDAVRFCRLGGSSRSPRLPGGNDTRSRLGFSPLRIRRRPVTREQSVGRPRHIVVYRVGSDRVVEIIGLARDRMLLSRAMRRMRRAPEAE